MFAWAEVIPTPGAEMSGLMRPSTVGPRLEKSASLKPLAPMSAIAPTVITSFASPGEPIVQVSGPSLPAATVTIRPTPQAALTASESAPKPSPQPSVPRERLSASMP